MTAAKKQAVVDAAREFVATTSWFRQNAEAPFTKPVPQSILDLLEAHHV